jgi:hypothetical protein
MYEVIQTPRPIMVNRKDMKLIVFSMSSGLDLDGSKESITLPIKNTNDGIPQPATAADTHPIIIRVLSDPDAKQYNLEYETEGDILLVPVLSLLIVESTYLMRTSTGSC